MSVKSRKLALGNNIAKALKKPTAPLLRVGVIGDKAVTEHGMGKGATVAEIATYHEYGMGVPQRSWLRGYVDENQVRIEQYLRNVAKQGLLTGNLGKAMETMGVVVVGEIQERISDHIPPPLSDRTKKRKGSDTPLIDTGQFRSSITFQVIR